MKKALLIRIIGIFMAFSLICSVFTGCGSKGEKDNTSDLGSNITESENSDISENENSNITESANSENSESDGSKVDSSDNSASSKKPNANSSSNAVSGNSGNTGTGNGGSSNKKKVVNIPLFGEPDELGKANIKRFEQKYGAKVEYKIYGWQEYQTRLLVMVNSGTAPDITPVYDQQYLMYVGKNVIQPVTPYINPKDKVWDSDLINMYKWGNEQYVVSTDSDLGVFGIYYNVDLFEEYDVDDPYELYKKGKWDFENFRRVAKELTVTEDGRAVITGFHCWKWDILVLANGGTGIKLGNNKQISITLGDSRELKAFELIQNMQIDDKSFDYAYQSADNYFKAGRIAMISERPAYASEYFKGEFEVGWVPLPKGPDVKGTIAPSIVGATGIPRGAKNPQGGMDWIKCCAEYFQSNPNDASLKKIEKERWPDANLKKRYDEYISKATLHTSLIGGCNNWDKSTRWGFWEEIFVKNTPPSTAVAKHKQELQYEINQVTK